MTWSPMRGWPPSALRYDLTGNVSGRCPECGEVEPAAKPAIRAEAEKR